MIENEQEKKNSKLKFSYGLTWFVITCVVAVVSSFITYYYITSREYGNLLTASDINLENTTPEESTTKIAESLKKFRETIDKYYIGEIDENKMLEGTIKGYVSGLGDEYSEYMTKEDWEEFKASALGNYVGVGIYMSMDKNNNIVVVSPIKDTPAEEAGIQKGDIIVKINDESTTGMNSSDAATKIKGEPGTKVDLTILRGTEYINVTLERKEIKVYHVENKMLEDDIGYIQLMSFDEGCSNEFKGAYRELEKQGAKKIIVDLRDNTGGLVDEALSIADYMIDKDKNILITIDSKGKKEINKSKVDPTMDCPIVVLVNEYSASASEILTGALKDNEEAKIVGTLTYGKGVIQNIFNLADGSVLKLTIAEYYTPNETKINKIGITPDYEVEDVKQENGEEEKDEQLEKAIEVIKEM